MTMTTTAQELFDALPDHRKLALLGDVFTVLEYDEDGNPGSEWSPSDTTQALGDLFRKYGVTFTTPGARLLDDDTPASGRPAKVVRCFVCDEEADAQPGSRCGRDLSEERGQPAGTSICRGVYYVA